MKNHWRIPGYCYWEKEISKDKEGNVWINVGYHLPLCDMKGEYTIRKLLSISALVYIDKFN